MRRFAYVLILATLAACGGSDAPDLLNAGSAVGDGPDEFAVLPTKPLTMPDSFVQLPEPTPGAGNRADPTPESDAIVALGGRPGVSSSRGDGALIQRAGRFGVQSGIRATLASEDLAFRRNNDAKFLERLFSTNVYFRAYESQTLDSYSELERMRRAGIRTPSAPPAFIPDE